MLAVIGSNLLPLYVSAPPPDRRIKHRPVLAAVCVMTIHIIVNANNSLPWPDESLAVGFQPCNYVKRQEIINKTLHDKLALWLPARIQANLQSP